MNLGTLSSIRYGEVNETQTSGYQVDYVDSLRPHMHES